MRSFDSVARQVLSGLTKTKYPTFSQLSCIYSGVKLSLIFLIILRKLRICVRLEKLSKFKKMNSFEAAVQKIPLCLPFFYMSVASSASDLRMINSLFFLYCVVCVAERFLTYCFLQLFLPSKAITAPWLYFQELLLQKDLKVLIN